MDLKKIHEIVCHFFLTEERKNARIRKGLGKPDIGWNRRELMLVDLLDRMEERVDKNHSMPMSEDNELWAQYIEIENTYWQEGDPQ